MEVYAAPVPSIFDSFGFDLPQAAGAYLAAPAVVAETRTPFNDMGGMRTGAKASSSDPSAAVAAQKKKKSRDGCQTCKNKRLKCDETKPWCRQCQKRGVNCEGYKKEYKWRLFDDSTIGVKSQKTHKVHKKTPATQKPKKKPSSPRATLTSSLDRLPSAPAIASFGQHSSAQNNGAHLVPFGSATPAPSRISTNIHDFPSDDVHDFNVSYISDQHFSSPERPNCQLQENHAFQRISSTGASTPTLIGDMDHYPPAASPLLQEVVPCAQSPDIISSLLNTPPEFNPYSNISRISPRMGSSMSNTSRQDVCEVDEDDVEGIPRDDNFLPSLDLAIFRSNTSPSPSHASISSADSHSSGDRSPGGFGLCPSPGMAIQEKIVSHFHRYTCGIMSIKDGQSENPWRTLMWPLAQISPALYHAICSMTAFHMTLREPGVEMRNEGVEHQRKACRFLVQGLQHKNMRLDAALGTTLVLAFSEVFDNHTTTGNSHLNGARGLLKHVLNTSIRNQDELGLSQRLPFLFNVWVYLDVLARLTSDSEENHTRGIQIPAISHELFLGSSSSRVIDPLLGCATALFPIIGRVGSLVQLVRKTTTNNDEMIRQALKLQADLDDWCPLFEESYQPPNDGSSHVRHCIDTAKAYRWATMLYLEQAVPEIARKYSAQKTATKIMKLIFSIPPHSGCCIVHIYPLLVAGCEAKPCERDAVKQRWESMSNRMWIGNVNKAWAVTQEVWRRRDIHAEKQRAYSMSPPHSRFGSPPANVYDEDYGRDRYEFSVRGELHWARVMKDRKWEILLG